MRDTAQCTNFCKSQFYLFHCKLSKVLWVHGSRRSVGLVGFMGPGSVLAPEASSACDFNTALTHEASSDPTKYTGLSE